MDQTEKVHEESRGTWWQRFLIWAFSGALTLLFYWLLSFILQDIGRLPGPDWNAFEADRLGHELLVSAERLNTDMADVNRQIENQQRRQKLLRDSTDSSQKTLSQLLELQRMSLEQKTALPEEQQKALTESQQFFIENQRKDQELSESLATLYERLAELNDSQRKNNEAREQALQPLRQEFDRSVRQHRLKVAAIKISVLTPLLILGGYLFARFRNSSYAPMVYAFDLAVLAKTFVVMHEYFPAEYFRYILIVSSIAVIGWLLARLLRLVAQPSHVARIKQYREAYESFFCPICQYPIRRGPLKFMAWTPQSLRRASQPLTNVQDEPYTCPSCSKPLFEKCDNCGATRHSLLPACEHCGTVKEL